MQARVALELLRKYCSAFQPFKWSLKKILLSSPRSGELILARRFNAETKEPRDFVA
jgi:hypothetical protein